MYKEKPKKIVSLQNPLVKHLVKLRLDPQYRKKQHSVLISGTKLIKELENLSPPKQLFSENPLSKSHILVSHNVMKKVTGLISPETVAAEFPLPSPSLLQEKAPLLVFDRINDPGNMGTLIRTALALGWEGIFFLPGCVDPFHDKVIRASRGALFHLPWREGSFEELKKFTLQPYIADIKGLSVSQVPQAKKIMLVLSNEAQGVSEELNKFGTTITIPMSGEMESLNVAIAGGIMMYELGRLNG